MATAPRKLNGFGELRQRLVGASAKRTAVQKTLRKDSTSIGDAVKDLTAILFRTLANGKVAVALLIVSVVLYYVNAKWPDTPPGKWCIAHPKNWVCEYVVENAVRLMGATILAVPVFAARGWDRVMWFLATTAFALFVPEAYLWQYICQAVFIHIFIQAQLRITKVIALVVVAILWASGYLILPDGLASPTADWQVRHGLTHLADTPEPVVEKADMHAIHSKIQSRTPLTPNEFHAWTSERDRVLAEGGTLHHAPGGKLWKHRHGVPPPDAGSDTAKADGTAHTDKAGQPAGTGKTKPGVS